MVFKVDIANFKNNKVLVTHAKSENDEMTMTLDDFFLQFKSYFNDGSILIDKNGTLTLLMAWCDAIYLAHELQALDTRK